MFMVVLNLPDIVGNVQSTLAMFHYYLLIGVDAEQHGTHH